MTKPASATQGCLPLKTCVVTLAGNEHSDSYRENVYYPLVPPDPNYQLTWFGGGFNESEKGIWK